MSKRSVLIIDDEKNFASVLATELNRSGFEASAMNEPRAAIGTLSEYPVDVVLLDIKMPGMDGIMALEEIRSSESPPEVIMLTGHATVDTALQAMKLGAYDYLTKPCKLDELSVLIEKAVEKRDVVRDRKELRRYLGAGPPDWQIIGDSAAMTKVMEKIDRVAQAVDVPVLISGESGVGKELVAREIHRRSPLAEESFVTLNCAALQPSVIESELFGHEKGSFTGATSQKMGLFDIARGGSLFLDEIAEIDDGMQAKLLRVIQFGEYRRVGGTDTLHADTRIIAATNRELPKDLESGRFRSDLYYRLNVVQIDVPPLRDRPGDVRPLVEFFIARYGGGREINLTPEAESVLLRQRWPGNVRELENCVRRIRIFNDGAEIGPQDVEECLVRDPETVAEGLAMEDVERFHILRVLRICDGNKAKAAGMLGIAVKTLYNKLNVYREQGHID